MTQQQKETSQKYFDEAVRYYRNGKDILKKSEIEYRTYKDAKLVAEACGITYLATLKALDGYLIQRGEDKSKLPKSYDEYRKILNKHLVHNGKVKSALTGAYEVLHILGYYRGGSDIKVIKEGFECAKFVIENLSKKKIV